MVRKWMASLLTLVLILSCLCVAAPSLAATQEKAPPEKIAVSGTHEVAKGFSVQLNAEVLPSGASQKVSWTSSDPSVATVSKKGLVTGVKAGKAVITVSSRADAGVKKKWKITVLKKAVKKIRLSAPSTTIEPGDGGKLQLIAEISPAAASQALSWKSSDKKIATVSSKGIVTGKKAGTVTITAAALDGSEKSASIRVTVQARTNCFALIIGNEKYTAIDPLTSVPNNVRAMQTALGGLSQSWQITTKRDLMAKQIPGAIQEAFKGATADDLCLFYYCGHGCNDTDWEPGSLQGVTYDGDDAGEAGNDYLPAARLASALDRACPGRVIVILDSCGSGSYIYNGEPLSWELPAFNTAILRAFSSGAAAYSGTGDLLGEKYTVLTACEHGDWGYNVKMNGCDVGVLTWCLLHAMGCQFPSGSYSGSMPADTNGDRVLTLQETFQGAKEAYQIIRSKFADLPQQMFCSHGDAGMILFRR